MLLSDLKNIRNTRDFRRFDVCPAHLLLVPGRDIEPPETMGRKNDTKLQKDY